MKTHAQPFPVSIYDRIENLAIKAGGIDDGPAALIYDQIEMLACKLWQQTGCQFGRYQECCRQAAAQLLAASQAVSGYGKKDATKPRI